MAEGVLAVARLPFYRWRFVEAFGAEPPTLRQVAVTPPYMHDGSFPTLASVIEHYNRGGHPNPFLDSSLRPLHLSPEDRRDLLAFLRSLTGEVSEGR